MAHTYTAAFVHLVFSTKDRRPALTPEIRSELYPYLMGIARELGLTAIRAGGWTDHVHLLLRLHTSSSIADVARDLKANSSRWILRRWPERAKFAWQDGYGAFTVSPGHVARVKRYIETQEEHHREVSFQEEFVTFLKRAGVPYDERYVWG